MGPADIDDENRPASVARASSVRRPHRLGPFPRLPFGDRLNVLVGCDHRIVPRAIAFHDILRLAGAPRQSIIVVYGRFGFDDRIEDPPLSLRTVLAGE